MIKILLLCENGASTSALATRMKKVAKEKKIEIIVEALAYGTHKGQMENYDVFLLAPQKGYVIDELIADVKDLGKVAMAINIEDYGMLRGEKVLQDALDLYKNQSINASNKQENQEEEKQKEADKPKNFIEKAKKIAERISSNRYLRSLRDGFLTVLPILIFSSVMAILAAPPFTSESTVASWPLFSGWHWLSTNYAGKLWGIWSVAQGAMGLLFTFAMAHSLALKYKLNPTMSAVITVSAFLLALSNFGSDSYHLEMFANFGARGMFTGIIITIFAIEVLRFCRDKNITIKVPDAVPQNIADTFASLIPIFFIMIPIFIVNEVLISLEGKTIPNAILDIFKPMVSVSNSVWAVIIATMLTSFFWFIGIHGPSVVEPILTPFYMENLSNNLLAVQAGAFPNAVMTPTFQYGVFTMAGTGTTLGVALMFAFLARSQRLKAVGKISWIPNMFSINEPILFGGPLVLNFKFFIPFIFAPTINAVIGWALITYEILPGAHLMSPWSAPFFINMFIGTMHIGWILASTLMLILSMIIYYPFFKSYDNDCVLQEKNGKINEDFK